MKPVLCSIFQRYNLKAIHNDPVAGSGSSLAVFNISKIQSKSNSQHGWPYSGSDIGCVQYFKDTI